MTEKKSNTILVIAVCLVVILSAIFTWQSITLNEQSKNVAQDNVVVVSGGSPAANVGLNIAKPETETEEAK